MVWPTVNMPWVMMPWNLLAAAIAVTATLPKMLNALCMMTVPDEVMQYWMAIGMALWSCCLMVAMLSFQSRTEGRSAGILA